MTQGDVEMINQGGDDLWVAKVDGRTGNVHWMTQLGNYGDESPARHKSIALNNDGNIIIYGDTTSNLYRARSDDTNEDVPAYQGDNDDDNIYPLPGRTSDDVSDMFIMVVNGETGAVDDNFYMGGTSSASVTGSVDGVPRQTTPPRNPTTTNDDANDIYNDDMIDPNDMKDKNALSDTKNSGGGSSGGGSNVGKIIGILFALVAVGFGLSAAYAHYKKKQFADTQKSTIFQCLQKFDVEDIDLRRSPPGGWHGTYMNKLAYGVNESDGAGAEPLGGTNGYSDDDHYKDQQPLTSSSAGNGGTGTGADTGGTGSGTDSLYTDNEHSGPSLGANGSGGGGYKDDFEIDGDDDVDIRLQGKDLV